MTIPPLAAPALVFFCNAFLYISLFSRMPGLVERLGMDKGQLGLSLLVGTMGTFLVLPFAGRIVGRLTPRRAAAAMLGALALIECLMFVAPAPWLFVLLMVGFACCRTVLEVAQNLMAAQIETSTGSHIMARSHGFWSIGLFCGSLFSGILGGMALPDVTQMILAGLVAAGLILVMLRIAPRYPSPTPQSTGRFFAMPDRAILLICAMTFGIAITEGAIYDWAAFYISQVLEGEPAVIGMLFAFFTVGMGGTRLAGDLLRARFPAPALVRCSAASALLGLAILVWLPGLVTGALGLLLIGCGVALNAPLAVTAATRIGSRPASENLAAMSMVNTLAFLGVPAGFGLIADQMGLKFAFTLLMAPLLISFLMAPAAAPTRR